MPASGGSSRSPGKSNGFVPFNFANPHGHVFDRWGNNFIHDGTGAVPYDAALFSGHLEYPAKHPKPPQLYQQKTRPCPATEILSSGHFPKEYQDNLLVANVIGFLGILRYRIHEGRLPVFALTEAEPILQSSDPNFRPVDMEIGPDGALYFTDWQNPIIGHMQHHIRDPNRDRKHGRVYRVTCLDRPLLEPARIAGEPIEKLVQLLQHPDNRVRYRAKLELSGRDRHKVLAAVDKWLASLDKGNPDYERLMLEGLWMYQFHNIVNADLLERVLKSKDHRARSAATRVLCYWRDRIPESLQLLKKLAADPHPRVRLEAVRAASFFRRPEAIEVPIISMDLPSDKYLDYTRQETMKALEPYWKKALSEGINIKFTSDAGRRYFLRNVPTDQLLKMKRDRGVYLELLYRDGIREEYRREALAGLAKLDKKDELSVLLGAIANLDVRQQGQGSVFDLVRLLTAHDPKALTRVRNELVNMATNGKLPVVRQIGFVALISADANVDKAWDLAAASAKRLHDLVSAMPLIPDPSIRAQLYPKVAALLDGLPDQLKPKPGTSAGTTGRFIRIELPGRKRVLTLAEVEVYSNGRNIARQGKATQKNVDHGGVAERAIDGNKDGRYASGGQTHTKVTANPWWQLDLGNEYPIDAVVIYNRTDGSLGNRLDGFTLKILDRANKPVFVKENNPAPKPSVTLQIGGAGPEAMIRSAAMLALTYVRGKETDTFKLLARLVAEDKDRSAAVRALQRIPRKFWPNDQVKPLVDSLLAYIRKLPKEERTSQQARDALQLGYALAAALPADIGKDIRAELGELGVRIIHMGTLPHRMAYDRERLVVQAGRAVEIHFENSDLMPHNLVIVQPGALEEIGLLAEKTAQDPDAANRQYVPKSKKVLVASRLLMPRDSQRILFTAPKTPGVYPIVCTYPGHWRRMYAALYVVDNLEEYLADPEGYVARKKLPIQDEMLKFNRPRKEWKFEELASSIINMKHGRSYANGKRMFVVAGCVSCHRVDNVGNQFGADLTKIDPMLKPVDILRDILEPSSRINEKYQSYIIETTAGKVITGLIIEETKEVVKIIENPLASTKPVVLKPSEIAERQKSSVSLMPKGLLDRLTREEILDLVAYVIAKGDPKHPYFKGGHEH
ncbi:MAG: hypothetical protein KatS3mg105_1211 [Gemmatales bacterium]|nr:MAG: hypothetical protein KatS3mg105_1211 [Gemmatales bacterium]